ncbi:MAG: hypothetical protein LIO94_08460 [Clostridiales bacterium]|nr:hypothetical protein [Clostridiales bacterium]
MRKKLRILLFVMLLSLTVPAFSALASDAAEDDTATTADTEAAVETETEAATVKAGWVKKNGYYYWRKSDGTFIKSGGFKTLDGKVYYLDSKGRRQTGLLTIKKKTYYLNPSLTYGLKKVNGKRYYFNKSTGVAVTKKFVTVKGKTYYFDADGCMVKKQWVKYKGHYYYLAKNGVRAESNSWLELSTGKYYINKKGYRVTGLQTIGKKQYYFLSDGTLVTSKTAYQINGTWYTINSKGVAKVASSSNTKVQCSIKTQEFIAAHTTSDMTNAEKFRKCFNYIMAYTTFAYNQQMSDTEAASKTWPYSRALSMLNTGLTGNCYGIASLVASCAKELGYEPYVVAIKAGHAFVIIDGKYYDNMGARFGTSLPALYPYTVRSQIKF